MNVVVIALSAALAYALLIFVEKKVISELEDYVSWALTVTIAGGTVALLLLPFVREWLENPLPLLVSGWATLAGYLLYLKALNRTSPSTVGVLMSARPLVSVIFSVALLSEEYSPQSTLWLLVISGAFILFSWNPMRERDLLSSALVFSALMVWMAGDSMVKFSSSSGILFVLGRNLYELPLAGAALLLFRSKIRISRIRRVWKVLPVYFVLVATALTLFFTAASQSFAIANTVSNSMTSVFTVVLGAAAAVKGVKKLGERGNMKEYAYKAVIASVIAFAVYQLYLSY